MWLFFGPTSYLFKWRHYLCIPIVKSERKKKQVPKSLHHFISSPFNNYSQSYVWNHIMYNNYREVIVFQNINFSRHVGCLLLESLSMFEDCKTRNFTFTFIESQLVLNFCEKCWFLFLRNCLHFQNMSTSAACRAIVFVGMVPAWKMYPNDEFKNFLID